MQEISTRESQQHLYSVVLKPAFSALLSSQLMYSGIPYTMDTGPEQSTCIAVGSTYNVNCMMFQSIMCVEVAPATSMHPPTFAAAID